MLAVSFLVMTAFASFESMFALFVESRFEFGATTIGYLFAWVGVVLALVQGVIVGRVVPRVGEHRLVPAAILVMVLALAGVASAPSVVLLMAAMGLLAMGMGFNSPSMLSVVSRLADPPTRAARLACPSRWPAWRESSARCGADSCSTASGTACPSTRRPRLCW